jgi:ABC-type nickel/cobalt efflux system permease component RcnA
MRYLLAMVIGAALALAATVTLSAPVSSWVVGLFAFDSPDQVSNLEDTVYLATSMVGLLIGWTIGWAVGGRFDDDDEDVV